MISKHINIILIFVLLFYCHTNNCNVITSTFEHTLQNEDVLVTIDQGTLKGYVDNDYFGQPYYGFKSVPYAQPPLGELRFQNPQPAKSWSGILDATVRNTVCVQQDGTDDVERGSEDCLYLHVYTKNLPKNNGNENLKPVMVWIHGGGFLLGSVYDGFGPGFLIAEDIVLVLIQYRLGYFGFLSIDNPEANIPGNYGLKDQVLALKWVQNNIKHFGGDSNQVTIFGESAGGTSVQLHLLSPLSKGLFHRAIIQSAATDIEQVVDSQYRKFAKLLNCDNDNVQKLVQCLRKRSAHELVQAQKELVTSKTIEDGVIGYTIEPNNPEAFLTEPIKDIVAKGSFNQVSFISGFVTDDGVLGLTIDQRVKPNFTDPEVLIPLNSGIQRGSPESRKWGNKIKAFYYGNTVPSYKNMDPFLMYETDKSFLYSAYKYAKQMARVSKAPVYFYEFRYHTALNPNKIDYPRPLVQHADDYRYLFVYHKTPAHMDPNSDEYIGVHRLVKLWTTFAKTGNPNPIDHDPLLNATWKPIASDMFNYLFISPNLEAKINLAEERMQFWNEFYHECCNDGFSD